MAVKSGMDNSPIATSQSYTITSGGGTPSSSTIYTKVTDPNLEPGLNYILVYGTVGMGTYSSGKGVAITGLTTLPNNKVDINGKDVIVFKAGGNVNAYTFIANDNYLAYNSSTNLKESTTVDDKARWTLAGNSSDGYYLINNSANTRGVIYNGTQFGAYATSNLGNNYYPAYLYVQEEQSTDPTLSVGTNALSINVPYDQSSATATFTVTGANLGNDNVTVSVSGADFSVSPTSITPADGSVSEQVTVTYSGTSTTPVTGTVTVTCGNLSETVTVTAQKELPPPPTMTATPAAVTFGTLDGGQLTVNANHLDADVNLSMLNAGYTTNTDKWTVTPSTIAAANGSEVSSAATVNYSGRLLKSDNTVRVSTTTSGVSNVDVPVHYQHNGPVYIVTSPAWDFTTGAQMNYSNGVYSATVNTAADTYLVFTKKVGNDVDWSTSYLFGPKAEPSYDNPNADWWLSESSLSQNWPLDSTVHHTVKMLAGTYTITLNAATNEMRIVPDVHQPVFSPDPGRYPDAQTVTISCDTPGAHIYYTTDGSTPSASNGTLYTGSIPVSETTTLKAVAIYGGVTSQEAEATYTIKPIGADDFILVERTEDITADDDYVLVRTNVSNGTNFAMGSYNSNHFYNTTTSGFELNDKVVTLDDPTTVTVFTLKSADNGQFYILDDDNNYMYYSSGNTVHRSETSGGDAYKWTLSIDSNKDVVIRNVNTSDRYLQANTGSTRYACYQLSSNITNAKLYKRGTTQPRIMVDPSSLDFVIPAGGTSQEKTVTVTETNTTGTTSVSITGTGAANYSATLENGTLTVTYNGTATQANPDVATITLTNDEATATVDVTGYKLPVTLTITPADGHTFQGSTVSGMIESNVASATIEYSLDGTTWQTYDANEGFTATVNTVGGTVTVYARTTVNGETATAQATYTRIAKTTTCTADIVFAPNSNSGSPSDLQDVISEGGDYVSSEVAATISAIYNSSTYSSLRFGSSSNIGYLAIPLNLANFQGGQCKINRVIINAARYSNDTDCQLNVSTDVDTEGITLDVTASETDFADYVFSFTDHSPITSLRIANMATSKRVYVHSITIEYNCGSAIEAPVIEPASGTYYAGQTVTITDATSGSVIYYTTDGTDPTTSSTQYNGSFTVPYVAGDSTTIKAIAVVSQDGEQVTSDPASVTYTWGVPTVSIVPASGLVAASSVTVAITATPAEATIYYTTDGSDPTTSDTRQLYENSFNITLDEVGDEVTVQAVAVVGNLTGAVASETYTRVAKIIDVNAPFFSPLQNQIYYGDQTLQMGCTTPNADIHYEIIEVSGEEAPNAAYVNDPNNVSTVYTQPINMREGYSYYVKAIAYVGDFHSTISEGWYTVKSFSDFQAEHAGDGYTYVANCAEFNALTTTGADVSFTNPVQVVYHSTYTNNGIFAEYCYVRDNTGYACIYFGKRDDSGKTIFKMGDWINGYYIAGEMNIWENNFHNQLGTSGHTVEYWPSSTLGWSEIIPTTTTCHAVSSGTTDGDNLWGNYVHLRNTTLSEVHDYNTSDPKHTGTITDASGSDTYYDKFYRWSAGTCSYEGHNDVIQHLGDYDQTFFTAKQEAGATFDVYGIVDYYKPYEKPFEICPIDFLWIYQPVINVPSNDQCTEPFTTTITVAQPEWTDIAPTIYYKTNEMEDWEEYTPGQLISISSTTTVMTYAEVPAQKTDGTNYNDYLRSLTETAEYVFPAVKDPMITPPGETYDLNVTSSVDVTVQTNPESSTGTVTYYTLDGSDPRTSETRIELTSDNGTFTVSENTTVNAASCLEMNGNTIWSNVVSETYQFIENDDKVYDLLKTAPVVGNIYVIVNKADNVGLSTTQNATNRAATGVMYVDANTKEQVKGNTHLATFVLEAATAGRYYFRGLNTHDYLCVNTNANPNLVTDARGSYAEATVTVNSGITSGVDESYPATVMMSYDGTRRYMRYYSAGRTFTTYDAATTNQDIFLYGLAPAELLPPSITPGDQLVQVVTGDEHVDATISTNYGDASTHTVYTTDGSDPRYSSTAVEFDDPAIILGYINTNTTVRAASYIEYEGDVIWSEPVKATYTFIGIKEPTITPASGLFVDGTTVNVTITTNPQNTQEGVQTYYTTDGTDPRTNGTLINGNSTTLPVTGNTTVQAASCVVVDGQTLWSIVVSETYEFTTPTPLCDIEKTGVKNNDYIVADELIGAWAVCDGNTKLLWAKDQDPYQANDLRPGKTTNQGDYVKELLKYQNDPWDESNWVVLDMSGVTMSPEDLVGQTIKPATIVGKYTDDVNYTIKLSQNPTPNGAVDDKNYTGWTENFEPVGKYYDRSYNTYVPANFMAEGDAVNNLNRIDDVTKYVVGAVAGDFALAGCQGDSLYFVNPKIQEVARIWGVWNGNNQFTIYEVGRDTVNSKVTNINAWDLKGCFNVVWDYNRVDLAYDYHKPNHLVIGEAYEFHAAIRKPVSANGSKRTKPVPDSETDPSSNYEIYPLDMSEDPVPTAVRETLMPKTVIGVTYFNVMGQESSHPYEGINIVVTRYSDGSTSAVKVLR